MQGFLANNDGILGNFGINNFYLYRFNNSTRHRLIPWDEDKAFISSDIEITRERLRQETWCCFSGPTRSRI